MRFDNAFVRLQSYFLKSALILANVLSSVRRQSKKRTTLNKETLGIFVPKHVTFFLEVLKNLEIWPLENQRITSERQ